MSTKNIILFLYSIYEKLISFAESIYKFLTSSFGSILNGDLGITFPDWVVNFLNSLFPRLLNITFIDLLFGSGIIILLVVAIISFIKNVLL